jgi:hypothetical protein
MQGVGSKRSKGILGTSWRAGLGLGWGRAGAGPGAETYAAI